MVESTTNAIREAGTIFNNKKWAFIFKRYEIIGLACLFIILFYFVTET